mgnify:CR=1 FL=1
MSKELEKNYNPSEIEDRLYHKWLEKKYFHAEVNRDKKPFTIVMPPPNITGKLHMGHALDNTMQDIIIRFKRMQGYEALWIPGTDHASISTEVKVTNALKEEGIDKHELGREGFLKRTWEWKKEYGGTITSQLKKIGSSCDWDRERFTMDEGCSKAVQEVFIKLYEKGLIYKGSRIVNWCPVCNTSISDAEVEHEEQAGHFWHINYPVVGEPGRYVEIATTRPETLLGDSALAVNPDDERYTDLVGKEVELPLTDRTIPIIADPYVDKEFGTGVVKITPAHDPNDFEVGKRHNLPEINILNDDATINNLGGKYAGMDRYEARKAIVGDLQYQNFLLRITDHEHNVGKCQRCNTTIEPLLSEQWFVKMEPLAKEAIAAVKDGRIKFVPERWTKNYLGWMENIRDWCISRQLWWGHQIPAYYHNETGEMVVAKENPDPEHYTQDTDCLDTWFSSGLWPFSTMGFPQTETDDFKKFYPTSVLVTGFDIIFFWVARMITMGLEFTHKAPFSTVYIHGLIRDEKGQKMSKSKGNTIDPVKIIDKYGCDALRFTLTSLCTYGGQDIKISDERFEYGRNFANKIWNASRFVLMNLEGVDDNAIDMNSLTIADKWILDKLNETTKLVNDNIKNYRIGEMAHVLYDFFWNSYCDWYVEIAKIQLQDEKLKLNTQRMLKHVLDMSLRLLHPIMPHITEKIWQALGVKTDVTALIKAEYPQYKDEYHFPTEAKEMELVFETITSLRNVRQSFNISPSIKVNIEVLAPSEEKPVFEAVIPYLQRLARVENVKFIENTDNSSKKSATAVVSASKIIIPLENLIDMDEEIARQNKKLDKLLKEKSSLEGRVNNPKFVEKAPKELVEETKAKIEELSGQQKAIEDFINLLKA